MPNTFSIENINLNGHILSAEQGRLFIDGEQIKNTSGIPINERFFIKGYAPVSFYSRWATVGNYLNETIFNDFFVVTGVIISCATPATGSLTLAGRFYARNPESVVDTETLAYFNLPTRSVYMSEPASYKIKPPKILGIDIYQAPNELKSISLNLMGYSSAAGHFDKMPVSMSFYERAQLQSGEGVMEQYNQFDATYTGIKILSQSAGSLSIAAKNITGYLSGVVSDNPTYSIIQGAPNISGYIIDNVKYFFTTGSQFSQFNNIPNFFNTLSGFLWQGFQLNADVNYFFSGYDNDGDSFGLGEIFEPIGQRTIPAPEYITGFLSGYKPSGQAFIPFYNFSGLKGDPRIGNLPLTSGESGYLIGGSGFYFDNQKYFFTTGRSQFNGFDAFPSIFSTSLGYQYYAISSNPDYLYSNFFSGMYPDSSGGYTGEMIGIIGYRYQPIAQTVSGFIKVDAAYNFVAFNSSNVNTPNEISGISGYYISGRTVQFKDGLNFSGFDGQAGFIPSLGYQFNGFNITSSSKFSGIGKSIIVQKPITGFISGNLNINNEFTPYTGLQTNSGYIIDGVKYHFNTPRYFLSGEPIIGYISGSVDEFNTFRPFTVSNSSIAASGYFIYSDKFQFPKGGSFNEFDFMPGFDIENGYEYSGFGFNLGSGYVAIENNTGIVTGYIGSRNIVVQTGIFNGITSNMFGFNDGLGFSFFINQNTFSYNGDNYISNNNLTFGPGIITGLIGYKNALGLDKTVGTGIMQTIIGYRNDFDPTPMSGRFYYKEDNGSKVSGTYFELKYGETVNRIDLTEKTFRVPTDRFVGMDIYNTLIGLSGISIALFGYYD
jgi:hypothetical protein